MDTVDTVEIDGTVVIDGLVTVCHTIKEGKEIALERVVARSLMNNHEPVTSAIYDGENLVAITVQDRGRYYWVNVNEENLTPFSAKDDLSW